MQEDSQMWLFVNNVTLMRTNMLGTFINISYRHQLAISDPLKKRSVVL